MNLQLPPERQLPDPDRMLDTILNDPESDRSAGGGRPGRARLTWVTSLAAAAAIAVTVGAIGLSGVLGDRSAPIGTTASPAPIGTPSVSTPTPTPSRPSSSDATKLSLGTAATFGHFSVTVSAIKRDAQGVLVRATVCVRSLPPNPTGNTTRISWDPWTVATGEHSYRAGLADASHPPKNVFPTQTYRKAGQCASGWLAFASVPDKESVSAILYANSLGDAAVWNATR